MKLFRVIIILSSLLFLQNCASSQYLKETQGTFTEWPQPVSLGEREMWSAPGFIWNHIQYMRFTLNDDERKLHQSAVYHALNETLNGETTEWFSQSRLAKGKVRILYTYPISDGHCRVYQSYIELNGTSRHLTNFACKRIFNNWYFYQ